MKLLVLALASLFLVSSADDKGPLFNIMKAYAGPKEEPAPAETTDALQKELELYLQDAANGANKMCSSCWQFFTAYSKLISSPSNAERITPMFLSAVCSVLTADNPLNMDDCLMLWKSSSKELTSYIASELNASKICPAALGCPPPKDLVLGSSFMLQGSDISLCSVCKTVGKMFVDALVEHLNKDSSVQEQLNKKCKKVPSFLRRPCKRLVDLIMKHLPELEKQGYSNLCKVLGLCKS